MEKKVVRCIPSVKEVNVFEVVRTFAVAKKRFWLGLSISSDGNDQSDRIE